MAKNTTASIGELNDTTKALRDVNADLARLEAKDAGLRLDLGDALAQVRLGDKKAQARASSISMDRAKLGGEIDSLRSEKSALEQRLEALRERGDAEHVEALTQYWSDVVAESRELERQLGEQMIAAAKTAQRLQALNADWYRANEALIAAGHATEAPGLPAAPPAALFIVSTIQSPEFEVSAWRNKYIEPTPLRGRALSMMERALEGERELRRQVEDEERQRRKAGGPFVVVKTEDGAYETFGGAA